MADVAFIATPSNPIIDPASVAASASELGQVWTAVPSDDGEAAITFSVGDATVIVMPIEAMHPDIPQMPVGPTGANPEQLATTEGHVIITALGTTGSQLERDCEMAMFAAVIAGATDAAGVMLGHNAYFHRTDVFGQLVAAGAAEGHPPLPILVSVTVAGDGSGRMSFLTHGLDRYGKEDLYVTCPVEGTGAVAFVYDTMTWFFDLAEPLPTGDSLGREESERIEIQRVPNPADGERLVVRLDLD